MADSIFPVALNLGMDTVTPVTMAPPGSLMDCLNYEMTADSGYRRIDGFERFDGWVRGEILDYYRVAVNILDLGVLPLLVPGAVFEDTMTRVVTGVVIAYEGDGVSGILTYAPLNGENPIIAATQQLNMNVTFVPQMLATANATKGSVDDDAETFVENLRSYSAILRALTTDMPRPIAGVHWFRNNAIIAMDSMKLHINSGNTASLVQGVRIGFGPYAYRILDREFDGSETTLYLDEDGSPFGLPGDSDIHIIAEGTQAKIISTVPGLSSPTLITGEPSRHATMYALASASDGYEAQMLIPLRRSVIIEYANGLAAGAGYLDGFSTPGAQIKIGPDVNNVIYGTIHSSQLTSGALSGGTGKGFIEVVIDPTQDTYTLGSLVGAITATHDLFIGNAGGFTKVADVVSSRWSTFPGTINLREQGTRYVWNDMNFRGTQDYSEAYGATGASPAFWARAYVRPATRPLPPDVQEYTWLPYACGSIRTQYAETTLDWPRYTAFHAHRLALGFEQGSVQLSVPGQPCNFSGFQGAAEVATGDTITGLVEGAGVTLHVFGLKSIRRITGVVNEDLGLATISSDAGAFHYTCIGLGATPVFVGPNGISTLEQAQEYGDFRGARASSQVQNTLVPKLVHDWSDTTVGSVAMAMQVREKNQYRLWLTTGEVYTMTLTADGPRIMKSNYSWREGTSEPYKLAVPFAWSSNTGDSNKEHLLVVWDSHMASRNVSDTGEQMAPPSPNRIYQLERGWGFDGYMMDAWFDLAHLFPTKGTQTTTISKVRMYGLSHGYNKLDVKASGIETDFEQKYHTTVQDISMPDTPDRYFFNMRPVTAIVDHANWGIGVQLRINNTTTAGSLETEPPVICQVLNLHVRTEGALDA